MRDTSEQVTFTVGPEGVELPSAGLKLPGGAYEGTIRMVSGKLWQASIILNRAVMQQLGLHIRQQDPFKTTFGIQIDITRDYERGVVRADEPKGHLRVARGR